MSMEDIAKQFTDYYYQSFDTNRANLAPLYRDTSMLTWEGQPVQGTQAITEKLVNLPFQRVQHKVVTRDAQPAANNVASMFVLVTGQLLVDDSTEPLHFSQVFHLVPDAGSYFVQNDVFRLNYG